MSKHNYSQYSKKNDGKSDKPNRPNPNYVPPATIKKSAVEETVVEPVQVKMEQATAEHAINLVEETVNTVALPEAVIGTVVNCAKLNVRATPDVKAAIIDVLEVKTEIKINVNESDNEWFKICTTTGIEGYCMRKFVEARL